MRVHFIAIGGAVMHNLAIALHLKGDEVSGSDDAIFEPSSANLKRYGLFPNAEGWDADRIIPELDAVILGMHARPDNPELLKAKELGIRIFSFPEFLYEQYRDKIRVVIAGSHGKTTITAMALHVLKQAGLNPDYMVGAKLEGFDVMVRISEGPGIAVLEGDEYLTSPLDCRPKFIHYRPHIALISGISWDHINVFPTEEEYYAQFVSLLDTMEPGGKLVCCSSDEDVMKLPSLLRDGFEAIPYTAPECFVKEGITSISTPYGEFPLKVFGKHNLENIAGAREVCRLLGVTEEQFYASIMSFPGAARRLEIIVERPGVTIFRDFAHAPSKLQATVHAVKDQYPDRKLIACFELHTFSSLNRDFLPHYKGSLDPADHAAVFFHPGTFELKRLPAFSDDEVRDAFGRESITILHEPGQLLDWLKGLSLENANILLMSSGDFHGLDMKDLTDYLGL